jgi:hypothetical protein
MTTWTRDELNKIAAAQELELAPIRRNGTARNPVVIWIVRLGDDLYVRCVTGAAPPGSAAPRCATKVECGPAAWRKTSFLWTPTPTSTTRLTPRTAPSIGRHGATYVNTMVSPEARSATIKPAPRSASS